MELACPVGRASDGHVLAIDVPALGWKGACASILGKAGETFGFLLLRSIDDYVAFVRLSEVVLADIGGRRASDPRRFGPAKTVLQAMRQANMDVTDQAAVEVFLDQFNRRVQDDPSLLPMATPRRSRWVWNGESPPPDPRGACPCGSGRRYKKCCMPR